VQAIQQFVEVSCYIQTHFDAGVFGLEARQQRGQKIARRAQEPDGQYTGLHPFETGHHVVHLFQS